MVGRMFDSRENKQILLSMYLNSINQGGLILTTPLIVLSYIQILRCRPINARI